MNIWGKLMGSLMGYLLLGPLGALAGLWLGHRLDQKLNRYSLFFNLKDSSTHPAQHLFFNTTFQVMGHIAKSDGRISEHDIRVALQIMQQLNLTHELKQKAKDAFRQGKSTTFNLEEALSHLRASFAQQPHLLLLFFELQQRAATADNHGSAKKQHLLDHIAQRLHIGTTFQFHNWHDEFFGDRHHENRSSQTFSSYNKHKDLEEAYKILGLTPPSDLSTLKKTYRRLMSQYHPDKLVAQGLPEGMIKIANQKTSQIRKAYDIIQKHIKNQ